MSSGKAVCNSVASDLLEYVDKREEATKAFIEERLVKRAVPFHGRMTKLKLKHFTFGAVQKKSSQPLNVRAERNLLVQLLMLSQRNAISLPKLFKHSLSPIPWSIATADGCLAKTNKARFMHSLEKQVGTEATKDVQPLLPTDYVGIVDGNALIRLMTALPETFGEFAKMLFCALPKCGVVHFVTDTYHNDSIKGVERNRRGHSRVHIIGGPAKRLPRDFNSFLLEGENKQQLPYFF